jgi:putative ABC transport system permease protein
LATAESPNSAIALATSGIRMALGATRGNVQALVFRQAFLSAMVGLGAGLALSLAGMRLLRHIITGLETGHGEIFVEVSVVMLAAALACWLPARRATKIDPMSALRQE